MRSSDVPVVVIVEAFPSLKLDQHQLPPKQKGLRSYNYSTLLSRRFALGCVGLSFVN